jgi:hypothetical protein
LRRGKFCYFHKSWQEQRVQINANQARRARSISLPVLEDANSIQVALMQVMRMIVAKEIDSKTAGLLLYALQTASVNLRSTRFEPANMHDVVLDPRAVAESPLGTTKLWADDDFEDDEQDDDLEELEEEEDDEEEEEEAESQAPAAKPSRRARKPPQPAQGVENWLREVGVPEHTIDEVKKSART